MGLQSGRAIWESNQGEPSGTAIWDGNLGQQSGRAIWESTPGVQSGRAICKSSLAVGGHARVSVDVEGEPADGQTLSKNPFPWDRQVRVREDVLFQLSARVGSRGNAMLVLFGPKELDIGNGAKVLVLHNKPQRVRTTTYIKLDLVVAHEP